jgi:lipoyl(octanoyl) transferase
VTAQPGGGTAAACVAPRHVRLGRSDYAEVFAAMRAFTRSRTADTADEIWSTEHAPVFTQGIAGRAEHVLLPGDIAVVRSDRGGQVTYHGPGQVVVYPLLDLGRRRLSARAYVTLLERSMLATLAAHGVAGHARADAPGVYVDGCKIGSLGLRIHRGCAYHGMALNVAMDLEPFSRIDPCGLVGMRMTQLSVFVGPLDVDAVAEVLVASLQHLLATIPVAD